MRKKLAANFNISWHLLSHVKVGGKTTHSCWFAVRPPLYSDLVAMPQNSIASLINYSHYLPLHSATAEALTLDDLLSFHLPDQLVAIPNRFTKNQLCMRRLQASELWSAWDIPSWVPTPPSRLQALQWMESLPPLKSLLAMADACSPFLNLPSVALQSLELPCLEVLPLDPRGTWLLSLRRWLPNTWTDGVDIADKAAKADTASIPKQLWNLRITLPLNSPSLLLERLWGFL
mmetsp:Transcript_24102/g.36627  ORF Transcript_24102/g.36627 Transcript_24102/m.36627 type:complete len:232 (-) Transcript_24102:663-1358(-)